VFDANGVFCMRKADLTVNGVRYYNHRLFCSDASLSGIVPGPSNLSFEVVFRHRYTVTPSSARVQHG